MKKIAMILLATAVLAAIGSSVAQAGGGGRGNRIALRHAQTMPWHGPYYNMAHGAPLGLVVPPTANFQTKMGWGVSQSEMVPTYHQFYRAYPGEVGGSSMIFSATPNWPSHTDQFGIYYIRGPW
jgi:hypothetical protein